jgi:hypothetical protein
MKPDRHDRKGVATLGGAVGHRLSAGRLGERLGRLGLRPGQDRSVAWFQPTAELPARF